MIYIKKSVSTLGGKAIRCNPLMLHLPKGTLAG